DEDLSRLGNDRRDEYRLAREEVELAEEAAGAVHADEALLVGPEPLDDLDLAGEDDDEVAGGVALAVEHLAGFCGPPEPIAAELLNLVVVQSGVGSSTVRRLGQGLIRRL